MKQGSREIIIATRNADKKRELARMLRGLKVKVVALDKFPKSPEVREGSKCFRENAILKAMSASRFTKRVALGDDSGLEVDALGGAPGVCSARFAGKGVTYADNNRKLLRLLAKKEMRQRGAQFRCVIAVCDYPKVVGVVEGKIRGRIAKEAKGRNGFGYDPLFIIPKYNKTFAQLTPSLKNEISHRGRALKKAKTLIIKYLKNAF